MNKLYIRNCSQILEKRPMRTVDIYDSVYRTHTHNFSPGVIVSECIKQAIYTVLICWCDDSYFASVVMCIRYC